MIEASRALKANPKMAGQPCAWCAEPLAIGADVRVCLACETIHHARCWDSSGGCSKSGCVNTPLARLDPAVVGSVVPVIVPAGYIQCPSCKNVVMNTGGLCGNCNFVLSPDGIYHGPVVNAPGALASLVWGIVGLFVCGLILGIIAINKSNEARKTIATSPMYGGSGLATAGLVMGIIDIIAWAAILVFRISHL